MDKYTVSGMSCAACQMHVEKAVLKVPGVESCTVSLLTNTMAVEGTASSEDIIKAVADAGYGAEKMGENKNARSASEKLAAEEEALKDTETPKMVRRLISSAAVLLPRDLERYCTARPIWTRWLLSVLLQASCTASGPFLSWLMHRGSEIWRLYTRRP